MAKSNIDRRQFVHAGLSALDMACGRLTSQANTLARLVFYKLIVR